MEPLRSKSSQFIERWANAEQLSWKLGVALLTVSLTCVVLSIALVYSSFRPQPIYYVPGVWEAGKAMPQQSLPQAAVAAFVSSWVLNWTNFTPATADDAYSRAKRFMSPSLLAQTQARLSKDMDEIKRNSMSSMFSITQDPVVKTDGKGFSITIQGDKGIYVGKEEIKTQRMTYRVRARMTNPTDKNPYGLMIEDIDQEINS
jgi:hypothetical protein